MGDVVPIGFMEWGIVAEQHKEVFGANNWDLIFLRPKFSSIANMTPPTGNPNILGYVLVAKHVMQAIEIKMDSREITQGHLRIEVMGEFDEESKNKGGSYFVG
jgi:hypothetical protein